MQAYLQLLQLLRRPVTDSNRALQQNRRHRPWYIDSKKASYGASTQG